MLRSADVVVFLLELAALLGAAHAFGRLFRRVRQPPVIGELLGGVVLGPTLFGAFFPGAHDWLFPTAGARGAALAGLQQLGLLLLMFCAGSEVRSLTSRAERRTIVSISVGGMVLPFAVGLLTVGIVGADLAGPANDDAALALVFGIALAVTSIPVISRIMFDLGILRSAFARMVLGAAVIEDIALYVVLSVAVGLVTSVHGDAIGIENAFAIFDDQRVRLAYHVVVAVTAFAVLSRYGPRAFRWLTSHGSSAPARRNTVAFRLTFMLAVAGVFGFLGLVPIFGAFLAGVAAAPATDADAADMSVVERFAFASFVPVYFAAVGLRLDLVRNLDVGFFLPFLLVACVVKGCSVYVSARIAGREPIVARDLAIAMNARGGPGIVVASVALEAQIIAATFHATLVMLAVVTSLAAGAWLQRVVSSGGVWAETAMDVDVEAASALARPG